jgi:hypothetical protein
MNIAKSSNVTTSEPTFHNARRNEQTSCEQYLHRQAMEARAAIVATSKAVGRSALFEISPTLWVRKYPMLTVGLAGVAGILTARVVLPPAAAERVAAGRPPAFRQGAAGVPARTLGEHGTVCRFLGSLTDSLLRTASGAIAQAAVAWVTTWFMQILATTASFRQDDADSGSTTGGTVLTS